MVALESMTENLSGALAKVGVEGSNPFARSKNSITYQIEICFPALRGVAGEASGKQPRANISVAAGEKIAVSSERFRQSQGMTMAQLREPTPVSSPSAAAATRPSQDRRCIAQRTDYSPSALR